MSDATTTRISSHVALSHTVTRLGQFVGELDFDGSVAQRLDFDFTDVPAGGDFKLTIDVTAGTAPSDIDVQFVPLTKDDDGDTVTTQAATIDISNAADFDANKVQAWDLNKVIEAQGEGYSLMEIFGIQLAPSGATTSTFKIILNYT